MLEKDNIQNKGFKNVYSGDKITGFQVRVRLSYYRGVFLTQLRPADPGPFVVKVDGEIFKGDQITIGLEGKTYKQIDCQNLRNVYWPIYEPVLLTVTRPGGLKVGTHDIEVNYTYTQCYEAVDNLTTHTAKRVLCY
jgi:hypothetical protein